MLELRVFFKQKNQFKIHCKGLVKYKNLIKQTIQLGNMIYLIKLIYFKKIN